jgi:hypothetical protein
MKALCTFDGFTTSGDYVGIFAANSTTGAWTTVCFHLNADPPTFEYFHFSTLSPPGGYDGGGAVGPVFCYDPTNITWIVRNDGTNLDVYIARDPLDTAGWQSIYSETLASFLGTCDTAGVAFNAVSASYQLALNVYGFTMG